MPPTLELQISAASALAELLIEKKKKVWHLRGQISCYTSDLTSPLLKTEALHSKQSTRNRTVSLWLGSSF